MSYALPIERVWEDLAPRANFFSRGMVLEMCVRASLRVPGHFVEFGVASGDSTRIIRRTLRKHGARWSRSFGKKRIYAFDSFEGLQETYENAGVGTFAGAVPRIPGVTFVKGYFEDTCTERLRREIGKVAFAHLDADLYSSTLHALQWLTPMLSSGSLLLFDEFTGGDLAEYRALDSWRRNSGLELIRLAEFDRDPSGFGQQIDRRLLYQVVGEERITPRLDRGSFAWTLAYYLGRLGLHEWKNRVENRD